MTNPVSPGVYVIEKDISEYTPSINSSVVGIVGFASKGPLNVATLITSQNQLVDTFGRPSEDIIGQGLEGALEILEETNSLYFVRCVAPSGTEASATLPVGSCPSVIVSGNGFGITESLYLKAQVYNNAGVAQFTTPKSFAIPAGTVDAAFTQADALRAVIGGALDGDLVGVFDNTDLAASGAIVGSFAGSGASLSLSAYTTAAYTTGLSALVGVAASATGESTYGVSSSDPALASSSIRVYGSTFLSTGTSSVAYAVESLYPGAGYNYGVKTDGTASGLSVKVRNVGGPNTYIDVLDEGSTSETFKTSFVNSGIFLEDVINTGSTATTSKDIKGNLLAVGVDATAAAITDFATNAASLFGVAEFEVATQDGTISNATGARWLKLVEGTTGLANGDSGISTDADERATVLIGDASQDPKTGMQSLDDNTLNIGIAIVPGIFTQSVQNALVTLAASTENFFVPIGVPVGIGNAQAAIDWTNGKSASTAGSRTSAITSNYAGVYFPHVKVFNVFDGKDVWYDPAIFAARQMAYTDSRTFTWFAPAGLQRAKLSKPSEVEVKLNQGDRDSLYSGGNVVNPIVSFPTQGIVIYGQRTAQRTASSLDRINVRRLMIYVRKVAIAAAQRIVFEPNDEFTWAQVEGLLNPFLDDVRRNRGITEFRVICDATVNTPIRVDRNELWCKVLIKPTKTSEIIIFELNLTNQSANLGNL